MREILFRGKRVDNGEWVEGFYYKQNYFYGDEVEKHIIITSSDALTNDFDLDFYEVIPETVGQFTGLTDKNGKRIFEGDILQDVFDEERMYEILYGEQTLMFEYRKIGYKGDEEPLWFMNKGEWWNARSCFEIIGNRFDNPEMPLPPPPPEAE
jgi:uncharacterized phage protein (TIGR01671 family)